MGISALGAAATAATTGVYMSNQKPVAENAAAFVRDRSNDVCIESNVRLVEGMGRGCLSSAGFDAMRDRAVIGGNGEPVEINLAAPDAGGADEVVRTCAQYDALSSKGWYALSNADMRREDYYKRACGALSMLVKAAPATSSNFASGIASAEDIRSMASGDAISFGEAASAPIDVSAVEEMVWRVSIGEGESMVYEIAHADFTGDGVGEILAYISVGARGGSMRSGSIGLIEKPATSGPCHFSAR